MDDDMASATTAASGTHTPRMSRPMTPLDIIGAVPGSKGPVWKSRTVENVERFVAFDPVWTEADKV